jgi:hypothetical protein
VQPQTRNHRKTLNDSSDLRHQHEGGETCSRVHALQKSRPKDQNRKRASIDVRIIAIDRAIDTARRRLSVDRDEGDSPVRVAIDDLFYRCADLPAVWTAHVLASGQTFFCEGAGARCGGRCA